MKAGQSGSLSDTETSPPSSPIGSSSGDGSLSLINSNADAYFTPLNKFLEEWLKQLEQKTPRVELVLQPPQTPRRTTSKKQPETPEMGATPARAPMDRAHAKRQGNHISAHSFVVYALEQICNSNDDYLCKLQKIKNFYEIYDISPGESIKDKINEILKNIELYNNPHFAYYKYIVEDEIKSNLELLLEPKALPQDFIEQQHESPLATVYGDKKGSDKGCEGNHLDTLRKETDKMLIKYNLNKATITTLITAISALFDANNIGEIKDGAKPLQDQTPQEKKDFLKNAILGHLVLTKELLATKFGDHGIFNSIYLGLINAIIENHQKEITVKNGDDNLIKYKVFEGVNFEELKSEIQQKLPKEEDVATPKTTSPESTPKGGKFGFMATRGIFKMTGFNRELSDDITAIKTEDMLSFLSEIGLIVDREKLKKSIESIEKRYNEIEKTINSDEKIVDQNKIKLIQFCKNNKAHERDRAIVNAIENEEVKSLFTDNDWQKFMKRQPQTQDDNKKQEEAKNQKTSDNILRQISEKPLEIETILTKSLGIKQLTLEKQSECKTLIEQFILSYNKDGKEDLLPNLVQTVNNKKKEAIEIENANQLKIFVIDTLVRKTVKWRKEDNDKTQDLTHFTQLIIERADSLSSPKEDKAIFVKLLNIHRQKIGMDKIKSLDLPSPIPSMPGGCDSAGFTIANTKYAQRL